jgi:hypothetical protein
VDYFFHCVPCATTTRTEGNGHTPTDHSAVNHNVRLGCSVINLDSADHMVDLVAQSTLGWAVSGVPASLLLTNGESVELFPEVTVPAGTPDWKTNLVTITSAFSGIANSTSSDTMDVTVQTPLQFVGIRPLSPGSWLLQLTGPWNALYIIEGSTNLLNWQTAAITQAPVGSGVVFVNVSPGPGAPAQFYRARAASMGP